MEHEEVHPNGVADCEMDAAFQLYWHTHPGDRGALPEAGIVEWAKRRYPAQHARLTELFRAAVREVIDPQGTK